MLNNSVEEGSSTVFPEVRIEIPHFRRKEDILFSDYVLLLTAAFYDLRWEK